MEQLSDEQRRQLDEFLRQHENQAYKMAYVLTHNRDDALELVQDSMLRLVQSYATKPSAEWKLLFYRILQNCIRDYYRRQGIRKLFSYFSPSNDSTVDELIDQTADISVNNPYQQLEQSANLVLIMNALKNLPLRQQQIFLLRAWQEFTISETATTLSISPGSVKTHYSRALQSLRQLLRDSDE
jgi:RNA polymerase sigma-70 factor, ECF subfamily